MFDRGFGAIRSLHMPVIFAFIVTLAAPVGSVRGEDAAIPCSDDPLFHQQDFTIGDWDVYEGTTKTAEVKLEKALKECAIRETWTSVDGTSVNGLGLFMYSRLLKSWGYFWVADNGWTTAFTGAMQQPDRMLYATEAPLPSGGRRLRRWTLALQSDGSVQELSVGSNDGKAWTTDYELIWRKRK